MWQYLTMGQLHILGTRIRGPRRQSRLGALGYEDYTTHKDKTRRERYIARHSREDWSNPYTPATLSRYLLWGDSTSLQQNLKQYIKMFKL